MDARANFSHHIFFMIIEEKRKMCVKLFPFVTSKTSNIAFLVTPPYHELRNVT